MNQDKFKKNFEELYKVAKMGISKEDKVLLLAELDEMTATLEKWKEGTFLKYQKVKNKISSK